ncbi:MAG TPA: SDR family NAD(P)-dependent oxidoreductase [Acidisoma sp.]|nr:SDR family NAD(P)-dependent oxidoreductase [Acidisoma sp.]
MDKIGSDLAGKTALITGGATGIGRAIATSLAGHGMRIAIADVDLNAAEAAAAAIAPDAVALRMDVTERASVNACFEEAAASLGQIDRLVANAGVSNMKAALDLTDADWDFNFNVNTRGVFLTNQAACRHFIERGVKGTICNTASLAAKVGAPLLAHYSASKFAVVGWTQALAREMAKHGIRVNAVCPGFVRTGMQSREVIWEAELRGMTPQAVLDEYVSLTPLGRIEEPEDVAKVVTFLLSDGAGFMTGQAVNVTGGVYMT